MRIQAFLTAAAINLKRLAVALVLLFLVRMLAALRRASATAATTTSPAASRGFAA